VYRLASSLVLWLLCVLSLSSCASTPKGLLEESVQSTRRVVNRGHFPFQGERLSFDVRHVATRTTLAEASIQVGHVRQMPDGTPFIPITGGASSLALARLFAKIDNRVEAYLDPDSWETIYSFKQLNENGRDRKFYVWFWHDEMSASVERHHAGNVAKRDYVLPPGTMDSIVWIYALRQTKLEPGKTYRWYTFDGWTLNRVGVSVLGEEDVWTPLGFFHCQKLRIMRERSEALQPQGALSGVFIEPGRKIEVETYELATAWLATNEARTPVRFVVETGLGEFDLLLREISQAQ